MVQVLVYALTLGEVDKKSLETQEVGIITGMNPLN